MKLHTQGFKQAIKTHGKELDSIITYTQNGNVVELGANELNSITPSFQGSILKSVMKQLDIDSNIEIPEKTILRYQFGVKVNGSFEYLDFGEYVVYKVEKQEDTYSYKITCYDKLLYSMVEYDSVEMTYPTTVRSYLTALCNKLGLTFKNSNGQFVNYDKPIPSDLYQGLGYTFRDVLDELAQVTASTICLDNNGQVEIRYINQTSDEIDEYYLKDVNVNFGQKYGPVNTIVLSRSAGADKISQSIPEDLPDSEKVAIEISDNQIMNFNNRDVFIPDILGQLNGLEYYINDFSSPGVCYYDLCDRYSVRVGENVYSCVMFNDEINVTQGLEENVFTEMPEQSEQEYTKMDKTDRRINQTYLIVDKQNQTIQGVVSQVDEQNEQIAEIRLQYNELLSRISDIADITTSGESSYARLNLTDVNASQPISIKIYPIGENISYLYPYNGLYPSDTLYMKSRTLRFTNTTTSEVFEWVLPTDLWYYDITTYDELELSYGDGTNSNVIVTRRCQINADGTVSVLATPTSETYSYPSDLVLTDGDYTVELLGYNAGYLYVQLMAKNIYTTQFYTKAETNSVINQKADEINLGVTQTLSNYSTTNQMNSAINLKANEITSTVSETYATKTTTNQLSSRISQTAKGISLTVNNGSTSSGITIGVTKEDGTTTQTSGTIQMNGLVKFTDLSGSGTTTINGANIQTGTLSASKITSGTLDASKVNVKNLNASNITSGTISGSKISGGTINGNNVTITNLNASNITGGTLSANKISGGTISASNISLQGVNLGTSSSTIGGFTTTSSGFSNANFSVSTNGSMNLYPQVGSGAVYRFNNGCRLNASSGIQITSNGGSPSFNTSNIDILGLYGASVYMACRYGDEGSERSAVTCADGTLYLNSAGVIYANGVIIGGSSSKATKENIIDLSQDSKNELYDLIKNIPLKQYDYKEQYGKKENYGFLIEDIENTKLNTLLHIVKNKENKDIKTYSSEDLSRIELVVIQELMKKNDDLQRQLDEMKKMIYNIKERIDK